MKSLKETKPLSQKESMETTTKINLASSKLGKGLSKEGKQKSQKLLQSLPYEKSMRIMESSIIKVVND